MLDTLSYVNFIILDISKAFDSVRHNTLLEKLSQLPVSDSLYNWLKDFFEGRTHSTKINSILSAPLKINASVIQGSGIGPASFTVNSSDLQPTKVGIKLVKYADDLTLLV